MLGNGRLESSYLNKITFYLNQRNNSYSPPDIVCFSLLSVLIYQQNVNIARIMLDENLSENIGLDNRHHLEENRANISLASQVPVKVNLIWKISSSVMIDYGIMYTILVGPIKFWELNSILKQRINKMCHLQYGELQLGRRIEKYKDYATVR